MHVYAQDTWREMFSLVFGTLVATSSVTHAAGYATNDGSGSGRDSGRGRGSGSGSVVCVFSELAGGRVIVFPASALVLALALTVTETEPLPDNWFQLFECVRVLKLPPA